MITAIGVAFIAAGFGIIGFFTGYAIGFKDAADLHHG